MSDVGRVAEAEVCESGTCSVGALLVRGDRISFVSVEQVKRLGAKRSTKDGKVVWEPRVPPADVRVPRGYVLVHDTSGNLLSRCDLYVVKWHKRSLGSIEVPEDLPTSQLNAAKKYYGKSTPIRIGSVDIPEGPWKRIPGKISCIRYYRAGVDRDYYEHEFDPHVELYDCARPIAWRLPLPDGCVVDDRGFVRP